MIIRCRCWVFALVGRCLPQPMAGRSPARQLRRSAGWTWIPTTNHWFRQDRGSNGTTTSGSCPQQAQEVARNTTSSQAFVLGRNLAVQFHPEMTSEILASWIATGGAEEIDRFGITLDDLVRQTAARDHSNRARAHRLVDQFLDRMELSPE